ncbi:MAG: haloacid dehalogenase-like hydrolase [Gammaproteobacteria bacterium]|nr:haloacid dehalogenase-like hydrolase [Gammaproteobacteria bacterium]
MKNKHGFSKVLILQLLLLISFGSYADNGNILPSWNYTKNKADIIEFVKNVSDVGKKSFVPIHKRVAVFDMDGTILVERPFYTEVLTSVKILKSKLKVNPLLSTQQPYKAIIENDENYIHRNGGSIVKKAGEDIAIRDLREVVRSFMKNKQHDKLNKKYKDLFYAPMIELIQYLVDSKFTVFVVSTSQQEFIRSYSDECFNLPKTNIIGSMMSFSTDDLQNDIKFKLSGEWWKPENGELGKVLRIRERSGYIPIFAVGNSSGDKEMMLATSGNSGFVMLVNHDDAKREYEYTKTGMIELAKKKSWNIVSMKNDFRKIYSTHCEL